jgi:hypothetical protein
MFHSNPQERGYRLLFRSEVSNVCPGCGRSHWHVGRSTAECAFCATALPIAESRPIVLAGDELPVAWSH